MSKTTHKEIFPNPPWKLTRIEDVTWVDSVMSSGWSDTKDYGKDHPTRCRSVGFLLSESKSHVQLVLSQDPECDNVNGAITIPKVAITKRRRIK